MPEDEEPIKSDCEDEEVAQGVSGFTQKDLLSCISNCVCVDRQMSKGEGKVKEASV